MKTVDKITNTSSQNVLEINATTQIKFLIPREIYVSSKKDNMVLVSLDW